MTKMSTFDISSKLQLCFVFAVLTTLIAVVAEPPQYGPIKRTKPSYNRIALCPEGWVLSTPAGNIARVQHRKLCVRLQDQLLHWSKAQNECHKSKAFLVKMDSRIMLGNVALTDYLKSRGLASAWTGMHHKHGTLVWDELYPHMVRAYSGPAARYGWRKRGWVFDYNSFKIGTDSCGKLQIKDDSSQLFESQTGNRPKRALLDPNAAAKIQRMSIGGNARKHHRVDNEELQHRRSQNEEKLGENSPKNQGNNEGGGDNVGEMSNIGEQIPRGRTVLSNSDKQADGSIRNKQTEASLVNKQTEASLGNKQTEASIGNKQTQASPDYKLTTSPTTDASAITTIKTTTTTDQSNLEDSDDYLLITKRSLSQNNTTSMTSITNESDNVTSLLTFTKESAQRTSAMNVTTTATTSTPQLTTSVEDTINRLMEASLEHSAVGDIAGSVDSESRSGLQEATSIIGAGTADQTKISEALAQIEKFKESYSNSTVNDDDPMVELQTSSHFLQNPTTGSSLISKLLNGTATHDTKPNSTNKPSKKQNSLHLPQSSLDSTIDHDNVSNSSSESQLTGTLSQVVTGSSLTGHNSSTDKTKETQTIVSDSDDHLNGDPLKLENITPYPKTEDDLLHDSNNSIPSLTFTHTNFESTTEDFHVTDAQNIEDDPATNSKPNSVIGHFNSFMRNIFHTESTQNIVTIARSPEPNVAATTSRISIQEALTSPGILSADSHKLAIETTSNGIHLAFPGITTNTTLLPLTTATSTSAYTSAVFDPHTTLLPRTVTLITTPALNVPSFQNTATSTPSTVPKIDTDSVSDSEPASRKSLNSSIMNSNIFHRSILNSSTSASKTTHFDLPDTTTTSLYTTISAPIHTDFTESTANPFPIPESTTTSLISNLTIANADNVRDMSTKNSLISENAVDVLAANTATVKLPISDNKTIMSLMDVASISLPAPNSTSLDITSSNKQKSLEDSNVENAITSPFIKLRTYSSIPTVNETYLDLSYFQKGTENAKTVNEHRTIVSDNKEKRAQSDDSKETVSNYTSDFYKSSNISNVYINKSRDHIATKIESGSPNFIKVSEPQSTGRPALLWQEIRQIRDLLYNESKEVDDFDESGGNSSLSAEDDYLGQQEELNEISLNSCGEEYASVCASEAIEELSLVGHCERNWYGHRLLDRCYKPVQFTLNAIEARQHCLRHSALIAAVDTRFYGNITLMVQSSFLSGSKVWVDASLNLDIEDNGRCTAIEDGIIRSVDCNLRLPFVCQKDAQTQEPYVEDLIEASDTVTYIHNLTSFHPQSLWCPLRLSAFDDVILWFKDGRPIVNDDDDVISLSNTNGQMPNRLSIELSILGHVGAGGSRILKPAMLQGLYWCEVWRREPFHRVVSDKLFLKFTDVITLYGRISGAPSDHLSAALFNWMGNINGIPAIMERRLATINRNITHYMLSFFPIVRDIISFVKSTNPVTGTSEFTTYICVATGDLSFGLRGHLADFYLSTFYDALGYNDMDLRTEWNLTIPARRAVTLAMADICPEANLFDKITGLSATFPSTAVNNLAASRNTCNGVSIGSAYCKGDYQSAAFWENWRVINTCFNSGNHQTTDHEGNIKNITIEKGVTTARTKSETNSGLADLTEVKIDSGNVEDTVNSLSHLLDDLDDLSASDIDNVVAVVDHVVSVNDLPNQISEHLVKTVNKVLDAPELELRKAELQSGAPSRLLADLEIFGEKVDMASDPRTRYVTPNVAMELWDLPHDSVDVVIGFGAIESSSWTVPLSEPRIQTIKDRIWAEHHLSSFDIAIEIPDSLVTNTIRYSDEPLRLAMFIYRKTGIFVQHDAVETSSGIVNSAIISASLGGRRIQDLEENVRVIFKPFRETKNHFKSTKCVYWNTETEHHGQWSEIGCVYNGTMNGRDVCLCNHLTNFAILTDFYGDNAPISSENETALTVLTIIGLVLSIIGLALTIITYLAFKKLRQGRAQQTLFNMAISLLCFQTTFLVGVKQTSIAPLCLIVSVLLHYFILVSFAWMLIEAVLQYLTFVKVLGTYISRYTLKTVIPAWGLPLVPVIAVLSTDYTLYLGRASYCWMNIQAFYYAFALPVAIIIVFNIIMFFVIIVSLATKPRGLRSNQSSNKTGKTTLKAAVTIFLLLGLTWLFGYLAIEDARLPFQYAFTILSSLQGFLIFLLMVARRRQVREQWEMMCCLKMNWNQKKQKKLSPTMSTSTTCSSSNNTTPSYKNRSYAGDFINLSSSVGQRSNASLIV